MSVSHPQIMGILNITPDSFSDGGRYLDPDRALERALELEAAGADWLDLGAESTRPGADPVSLEEELRRLLPILAKVQSKIRIPLSVDTQKTEVARQAIAHGATLINDVNALQAPGMLELVARTGVACVLMHCRGGPRTMQRDTTYADLLGEVCRFLQDRVRACEGVGITRDKIFLDPGIGFGKDLAGNLTLLSRLGSLREFGCPLLVGASRKSFLRQWVGADQADQADQAVTAHLIHSRVAMIRVHDVRSALLLREVLTRLSS